MVFCAAEADYELINSLSVFIISKKNKKYFISASAKQKTYNIDFPTQKSHFFLENSNFFLIPILMISIKNCAP